MLRARLLCLAAVAAAATAADMPKVTLKESGESGQSCDLTKVSAQLAMTSSCDVKTTVLGPGQPISLKAVSAKVDTATSTLSALAKGVNKMKCDSVGLVGTRFGEGSGCACPACLNDGALPTQVNDGDNPCRCECPSAWEGEQCQNKVVCDKDLHCNGHATAATGFLADAGGCQCTCIAEPGNTWKGSTCGTCESGAEYDGTDATKKSRWQNENGQCAPCPDGWDCNGSSTKTDVEECAQETNQCNYGASCYDSHSAAPNTKAVGTWTCGCDTVTETTADKVFFDATTQNCEYKPCADKDDQDTWELSECQTGSATSTWHDGTTVTSSSEGSKWDQNSTISGCKCACAAAWGGDACTTAPTCTLANSLCSTTNTKGVYGFKGAYTLANGDKKEGCHCECKEGWTGDTCEESAEPSDAEWEEVTSGNCADGALVTTVAECSAAYASIHGETVQPIAARQFRHGNFLQDTEPAGCHIGEQGMLWLFSAAVPNTHINPCRADRTCFCRKTPEVANAAYPYGKFTRPDNDVVKYWAIDDQTSCTPIIYPRECSAKWPKTATSGTILSSADSYVSTDGGVTGHNPVYWGSGSWNWLPYGCFAYYGGLIMGTGAHGNRVALDGSPTGCTTQYPCLCTHAKGAAAVSRL
jgi:hypothetical protein